MKQIQSLVIATGLLLCLAGCNQASVPSQPAESFKLRGHSVKFSPPKDFTRKEPKTKGMIEALLFENSKGKGHIGLTVIDGATKEDKVSKEVLAPFVEPIYKRDGKLKVQKELSMLGGTDNAYRVEFEYGDGATQNKGAQVFILNKGNLYSIVMTAPANEFSADLPFFDAIVDSFQIEK